MSTSKNIVVKFFSTFPANTARCFSGAYILWHLAAGAATAVLAWSGFDWAYFNFFRSTFLYQALFSAALAGFFVPVVVPLGLLLFGLLRKSAAALRNGFALGQAALLGMLLSFFYKAFTGRVPPPFGSLPNTDVSQVFRFGWLRGGVFWGWPSSHTTVAFAMAAALIALYPKRKAVIALSLIYAFYIGLGVSVNIHWFSDFVAGAVLGAVVGTVVGKSFSDTPPSRPFDIDRPIR